MTTNPTDRDGKPIDLPAVLAAHREWRETNSNKGMRADLSDADLSGAYLSGADLRGADLSGADLRDADLRDADLRGADLGGAYLRDAYLRDADLRGADLRGADLRGADLRGARGSVLLTETDHGYRVLATQRAGEWRILAGCRYFTIAEARAHWSAADYRLPMSGRRIVACLDWLEGEIANGFTLEDPK